MLATYSTILHDISAPCYGTHFSSSTKTKSSPRSHTRSDLSWPAVKRERERDRERGRKRERERERGRERERERERERVIVRRLYEHSRIS
jgi:hypothetical protein